MLLKNRPVAYSCILHTELPFDEWSNCTHICIKIIQNCEPDTYIDVPKWINTPALLLAYCNGIESFSNIRVERKDYTL